MTSHRPTAELVREISADLPHWREVLARSTAVWANDVIVEPGIWSAFTGEASADYNIVVCHDAIIGADGPGRDEVVSRGMARLTDLGAPGILMVAGRSLGEVQPLVDAGWVCVGANPLMAISPTEAEDDARVDRLGIDALSEARTLLEPAFGVGPDMARVALPDRIASETGLSLWGLRDRGALVSCVAVWTEADVLTIWSMATPPTWQRRGHGRALLGAVLHRHAEHGARVAICSASMPGEGLYRSMGFQSLERWQLWSRRRWVLGRT